MRVGDLVVTLNHQTVRSATDLNTRLALLRVGERVELEVLREGRSIRIPAVIADPFERFVDGGTIHRRFKGALLGEVTDKSGLGTHPGIAVGTVTADSNAWNSGLREGDVVFQANRVRTRTLKELEQAIGDGVHQLKLRGGDRLVTLISR